MTAQVEASLDQCEISGPHTHSVEETSVRTGMAVSTLRAKASRRQIPSTRAGKEIRFTDEQITQIITAGSRPVRPPRRDSRRRS